MSDTPHLDALATLTKRPRRPCPKPEPRLTVRVAEIRKADRAWVQCCRIVDQRDGYKCRCCLRRVVKTLSLCTERLEHHHLEARSLMPALTNDPRNVITMCKSCHLKLTQHDLEPSGHRFEFQGGHYLNADCPLIFLS
jgi:hypothetical protein